MQPLDPAVVDHYSTIREEERITAGLGQLELVRVREVLGRHLPPAPADVLDLGGATGVHAAWLAEAGHRVQIVDVTPRHVEAANAKLGHLGVTAQVGDGRQLDWPDASFDVALVFGPLYHLTERPDRLDVLREALRVIRPGGLVALAAISRFASLFDGLARGFLFDSDFRRIAESDLTTGQHRNPDNRQHWFTTAFFHHPDELRAEATEAGLAVIEQVGVEGLAAWLPQLAARWEDLDARETICWAARAVESEASLAGLSAHLLLIARVPASAGRPQGAAVRRSGTRERYDPIRFGPGMSGERHRPAREAMVACRSCRHTDNEYSS